MVNTTSNASGKQSYPMWEEGVADSLADKLGISYSDAQGIILSNEFYMAQAWAKGMNEEQTADFIDKKSTSMAKGGIVYSNQTDPIKYLNEIEAKPISKLNYFTEQNGIDFYIGTKGNKAIVVAFIDDESKYMIDKEDAREMSITAKSKGIDTIELHTNYGIELNSKTESPKTVGFDKIYKVSSGFAKGGGIRSYEIYHKTLASALEEVEDWAARNGYTFTSEHYFPDVTIGGVKYGETKRFKREVKKDGKNKEGDIAIQVYRMDSGTYELNLYPTFEKGGMMANGGNLRNSNVNVTNEMRGEDSDEYGTFEIYKDGGNIEVSVINSDRQYSEKKYDWILGDKDKDGIANADDIKPLDKKRNDSIDEPTITTGIKSLISLKKSLDSTMYSFIDELKDIAPNKSKIYARTKTPYSVLDKLVKKRLKTITDLIGTTVVTNDKKELDKVKTFVESGKMGKVIELEDMYKNPKGGYRAYHFLIERNGMSLELQLKTKRQKAINELSHEPYKLGKINSQLLLKMTEVANRADEGDKTAIKEYNDFMKQPDIENVFYAEKGGYMAKGGGIDKTLISSIPKRRRADRKYTHFAVGKSDNKILNGWDYSEYDSAELNADKYHYFYYDMNDMDVSKNDYTIKKAQTLIREGINPFDFNNWKNLDFSINKMAQGGGVESENEVLSFFNNIDYSKLPPAFSDYIKKEILTDDDLQYLSPREPIFLEIKSKVEGYSSKPTTQTTTQAPTETGQSEDVKKYMAEIADIQFLIDIETDESQIAIYKQEIEDLQTLIELES